MYRLVLASAFFWHMGISMAAILVPLYAHSLGYSHLTIGALLSLPIILHASMRLVGGALADRWTERTILIVCFTLVAAAGPLYMIADNFGLLLVAQVSIVLSRAFFYASAQSYVSRTPSEEGMGKRLGRLHVANNVGGLAGMILAGVLLGLVGFDGSFLALGVVGLVAIVSGVMLPRLPARSSTRSVSVMWTRIADLLKKRQMALVMICAFGAATPAVMASSFYPLYISHLGHGETLVGALTAFRAVGAILAGWLIAHAIGMETGRMFFRLGYLGLGSGLVLLPFSGELALLALLIGIAGLAGGVLDISYQTMVAHISNENNRGSAFALGGMGWSLAHLTVPISFGAMVDAWGFSVAFHALGVAMLGLAALAGVLYRWLMATAREDVEQAAART